MPLTTARSATELVVGAFCLVAALWLSQRWGRTARRTRRSWLAAALLWALYLQPVWLSRQFPERVILITEGYDREAVAAAVGEDRSTTVYALGVELADEWKERAESAPDAGFVARRVGPQSLLSVHGWGLDVSGWSSIDGRVVLEAFTPLPLGPTAIDWPRRVALGRSFEVRCRLEGIEGQAAELELVGPAGVEDALSIPAADPQAARVATGFALRGRPRVVGRQSYELVLRRADGASGRWPIDLVVEEEPAARVLWLQAAPSFDERSYRALAERAGASLVTRTEIAPGRVRTHAVNANGEPVALEAESLERFDLLVLSTDRVSRLRRSEALAVQRAVERGLGLLLLAEDRSPDLDRQPLTAGLSTRRLADGAEYQARLSWANGAGSLAIPGGELELSGGWTPLVVDQAGRVVAARRTRGEGRVVVSLVTRAYRWRLEGEAETYASYWSELVGAAARRPVAELAVELPRGPLLRDEARDLLLAAGELPPARLVGPAGLEQRVGLRQDLYDAGRFTGRYWPLETGWNRLEVGGWEAEVLVSEGDDWLAWRGSRRLAATRERALDRRSSPGAIRDTNGPIGENLWPQWILLLLLLVAWGRSWLGERGARRDPGGG